MKFGSRAKYVFVATTIGVVAIGAALIAWRRAPTRDSATKLPPPVAVPWLVGWDKFTYGQTVCARRPAEGDALLIIVTNRNVRDDAELNALIANGDISVSEWKPPNTIIPRVPADLWLDASTPVTNLNQQSLEWQTQPAEEEKIKIYYHLPERIEIQGRPVSLHGKYLGSYSISCFHKHTGPPSQRLVQFVSATGPSRRGIGILGGKSGPGSNEGVGFLEVFRLSDGSRSEGPFQLPECAPWAGIWSNDDTYICFLYAPNRVVLVPVNVKRDASVKP